MFDNILQRMTWNDTLYKKALSHFNNGRVRSLKYNDEQNSFEAQVVEDATYHTKFQFEDEKLIGKSCTCRYDNSYYSCEHTMAVMKQISLDWHKYEALVKKPRITSKNRHFLKSFYNLKDSKSPIQTSEDTMSYEISPVFCIGDNQEIWLEFRLLGAKSYKMRNISSFLTAYYSNELFEVSSKISINPKKSVLDELSIRFIKMMHDAKLDENVISRWEKYHTPVSSFRRSTRFYLTRSRMLHFFEIMNGEPFEINNNITNQGSGLIVGNLINGNPSFSSAITTIDGGIEISFQNLSERKKLHPLDDSYEYIFNNENIYRVSNEFAEYIKPIIEYNSSQSASSIAIPDSEIANVFSSILPRLEKLGNVTLSDSITTDFALIPLETKLYFDKYENGAKVGVRFNYDSIIIDPIKTRIINTHKVDGKPLLRALNEEKAVIEIFTSAGFKPFDSMLVIDDEQQLYDFLKDYLPLLKEIAQIFYSNEFKCTKLVSTGTFKAGVKLSKDGGMLEMKIDYEGFSPDELREMLSHYKLKKKYHRLKSGTFVSLESKEVENLSELFDQLNITNDQLTGKLIELPRYRALYIDSAAKEKTDLKIDRGSGFKKLVADIREPSDLEFELPEGIQGQLRDYQKIGFKWLKSLASYGFGGILADDMGIGKTLQVLSFIMSEKENNSKPSIVIAPTSLVYNWEAEVQKFVPNLKVQIIIGVPTERQKTIQNIDNADLIITSYGLVKRDIEIYKSIKFKYCFIDEAQHIKNPNTLNAKSVKKIKADGYYALTGTPIENSLTELWSIFDFLMPSYLPAHGKFVTRFETPIVKNNDKKAMQELKRHIQPFILRRMKKDVLKELPPKIENKMLNEMTPEQLKIYTAYVMKAKKEMELEIKQNGFEKSHIKILSILTRLRQICCHPSLFIENYDGGSGKLEMLKELLEDIFDSGHRVLLFSQFTSMLSIVKSELDSMKIAYHYLDGSTPSAERMKLVNSFNEGENKIFLLSLKAGGTGLNLTGADVVIHYDPWWNPAVEDQATDRAYRIGQKNSVSVYKLITKGTLEEKIFALQERKKELIDSVIKPGENFLSKMSEAELRSLFEF